MAILISRIAKGADSPFRNAMRASLRYKNSIKKKLSVHALTNRKKLKMKLKAKIH